VTAGRFDVTRAWATLGVEEFVAALVETESGVARLRPMNFQRLGKSRRQIICGTAVVTWLSDPGREGRASREWKDRFEGWAGRVSWGRTEPIRGVSCRDKSDRMRSDVKKGGN
jgi:hypothetical protein